MNPKRVAGILNLLLAAVLFYMGFRAVPVNKLLIAVGLASALLGVVRLRKTPPGPLPPS